MRTLLVAIILVFVVACNQKGESVPAAGISVTGAGSTNFGKVRIGEHRLAGILIKNPTADHVEYSLSGITPPFTIDGVQGDCTLSVVRPHSNCIVKIRFAPTSPVESFMSVNILGETIAFQGKGLMPGTLALGLNSWNAGTFRAGEQRTLNLPISNIGDTNLSIPRVATPGFAIVAQNCGTELVPGESCMMVVSVQKAIAQEYIEQLQFYTLDSSDMYSMDFIGQVVPGEPSGTIEFQPGDTQIIADLTSESVITTKPIRDAFGNVVSDGEVVVATPSNLVISGATSATTIDGQVSFTVRATGTTGPSRLTLTSSLSSGVYNITTVSGPPSEDFTLRAYNPFVRADGLSTITLETNPILDASGNLVTDGTQVEVILDGPGSIVSTELITVGGVLRVKIKSTTVAATTKVIMRANPIRDPGDNIIGYQAYGEFPINFIPLDEIGNFDVVSEDESIYFLKNGSGRVDETLVSIVDIRDENDNPVGAGFTANIKISNGVHAVTNLNSFSMATDADSTVSFPVKGIGLRDWITVDVTINDRSRSHRIFAVGEQEIQHNKGTTNRIVLKEQRASSIFDTSNMPPNAPEWRNVEVDYYGIRSQDNSSFGFVKSFGAWTEIAGPMRHLIWDCIIPVHHYVGTPPCEEKKLSGDYFDYRSYSIHEIVTERSPETFINGNIPVLPSGSSAFGEHILGTISAYDKATNSFHIFGGVAPNEVSTLEGSEWVTKYGWNAVNDGVTYGDITLMAYTPFGFASHTRPLAFPVAPSYYRYKDEIYIFGGLKKETPGIVAGNMLQLFKDGDLSDITVADGPNGSPVGRYQNGVYFEEDTSELFVFGGRNANGDFMDEIWKVDLSSPTKEWERVCNLCGLIDNTVDNAAAIVSMITTPVSMPEWQAVFEPMRPPLIIKDRVTKKTYYTMPYTPELAEIDFTTGQITPEVEDEELLEFRNYGHLVQHHTMDRFYRHDIVQAGTTNTKLYYKDGNKGEMVYYMAEILADEEARLYSQDIIPTVSAYSLNSTTRLTSTVSDFGASIYLYDFDNERWVLVGESTISSPGLMSSSVYNVAPVISSPQRFFSEENKVYVLIKPKHEVGYQIRSMPDAGSSNLLINLIQLNGVF